jgi:hypothetical protein
MNESYLLVKNRWNEWWLAGQNAHGSAQWTPNRKAAKKFKSQKEFRCFESSTWPYSPKWSADTIRFIRIRSRVGMAQRRPS